MIKLAKAHNLDRKIKKGQIKVKGYGPTRPRYSNDSQEFRFKNRRVEIYIN